MATTNVWHYYICATVCLYLHMFLILLWLQLLDIQTREDTQVQQLIVGQVRVRVLFRLINLI